MSYFLRERDEYGEMGTYSFAKVLYKSRNLCGNFCKAKSPTHSAVCIYALTEFSVPLFSNTHILKRPALIVRCLGVADVLASVHFARTHQLLVAVRGGGHNFPGTSLCAGG